MISQIIEVIAPMAGGFLVGFCVTSLIRKYIKAKDHVHH